MKRERQAITSGLPKSLRAPSKGRLYDGMRVCLKRYEETGSSCRERCWTDTLPRRYEIVLSRGESCRFILHAVRTSNINIPFRTTVPIPASAAPAPPTRKQGLIRFIDPQNPGLKAYLSRTLSSAGGLTITPNQSDALVVECDPGGSKTVSPKVCRSVASHVRDHLTRSFRILATRGITL